MFSCCFNLISVAAFSKSRVVPLKFPVSLNLLTSFPSPSNLSFSTSSSHNHCVVPSNHQLYHLLIFLIINWPSKAGPRHHLSCSRPWSTKSSSPQPLKMAPSKPKSTNDDASSTTSELPPILKPKTEKAKVTKPKADKPKAEKAKTEKPKLSRRRKWMMVGVMGEGRKGIRLLVV